MLPDSFFEYLSKNLPMGGFQVMPFFNTSVAKSDMLLQCIDIQHLFNSFRDYSSCPFHRNALTNQSIPVSHS